MKKRKISVVVCIVLVFCMMCQTVSAAAQRGSVVVWNSNLTLSVWAECTLNGRTATFKARLGGPDKLACNQIYAEKNNIKIEYGILNSKNKVLKSETKYLYYVSFNTMCTFLVNGAKLTAPIFSGASRSYMKIYMDGELLYTLYSK